MPDRGEITGVDVLRVPALNKSSGFTEEERDRLKLRGLLPVAVLTQDVQLDRTMENVRRKADAIEKYIFLNALQSRNERLFYRALQDHIEELLPIVYTPTVGQACREFAHIFQQTKGFYVTPADRGQIREILDNWPEDDVRIVVATDGERILGLGDLGASGMGIPIGKLALYVACAGIHPRQCLPVMLDVGTDNEALASDPLYLGVSGKRLRGPAYDELVAEFIAAIQDRFPGALIQFEDFQTANAYKLMNTYRDKVLSFNDDIQGTAAVVLAGFYSACRLIGRGIGDMKVMFLGAGSAASGIADLTVPALVAEGLSEAEARQRLWFVDINGLVVQQRNDLAAHNLPYAHAHPPMDFIDAIRAVQPDILVGATGTHGAFTEEAIRLMAEIKERPGVFALSNPTSQAECTAEEAYLWSGGRAIFASGSPFAPVTIDGRTFRPGQGNNVYIFPGVGAGALFCRASRISDEMFLAAARALAAEVGEADLAAGAIYPPMTDIRNVSLNIATAVAEMAYAQGLAGRNRPADIRKAIAAGMYDPRY
ncbi:MAG: NAD-dependent malic enzyme [Alphaproteobacteria bacterium]